MITDDWSSVPIKKWIKCLRVKMQMIQLNQNTAKSDLSKHNKVMKTSERLEWKARDVIRDPAGVFLTLRWFKPTLTATAITSFDKRLKIWVCQDVLSWDFTFLSNIRRDEITENWTRRLSRSSFYWRSKARTSEQRPKPEKCNSNPHEFID